MAELIAEYSPNIRWGQQHVEIVLKQWEYERTYVEKVGGNCHGLTILTAAISNLADRLWGDMQDSQTLSIEMLNQSTGRTLLCENQEDRDAEDWISDMCVSVRVIGYDPPTLNQVREMNGAAPVPDGDQPYDCR